MTQRTTLTVQVTDAAGRAVHAGGLARWLERAAPRRARGSVAIAIVNDSAMRRMNATFRGIDRATDVLAFRDQAARRGPEGMRPLGDIAIAKGVATRQAQERGHSLETELRILALHGLLHLMGFDHHRDRGEMRRLEERLRRRAGLPTGLIARAGPIRRVRPARAWRRRA